MTIPPPDFKAFCHWYLCVCPGHNCTLFKTPRDFAQSPNTSSYVKYFCEPRERPLLVALQPPGHFASPGFSVRDFLTVGSFLAGAHRKAHFGREFVEIDEQQH